jgi:hypothetical protein
VVHQRADDGHQHAEFGEMHTAFCGLGVAQSLQSEDEEDRSEQVAEFDEVSLQVFWGFVLGTLYLAL